MSDMIILTPVGTKATRLARTGAEKNVRYLKATKGFVTNFYSPLCGEVTDNLGSPQKAL